MLVVSHRVRWYQVLVDVLLRSTSIYVRYHTITCIIRSLAINTATGQCRLQALPNSILTRTFYLLMRIYRSTLLMAGETLIATRPCEHPGATPLFGWSRLAFRPAVFCLEKRHRNTRRSLVTVPAEPLKRLGFWGRVASGPTNKVQYDQMCSTKLLARSCRVASRGTLH